MGNCVELFVCLGRVEMPLCHFKQEVIVIYFHVNSHLRRVGTAQS